MFQGLHGMAVMAHFSKCPRIFFLVKFIIQLRTLNTGKLKQNTVTENISELKTPKILVSQIKSTWLDIGWKFLQIHPGMQ